MNRITVLSLFISVLFFSCKKEKINLTYEVIHTDASIDINNIFCLNADTVYACGGKQGFGKILKSVDGGNTWNVLSENFNYNLYSIIIFPDGKGFAGADSSHVYKTVDGGLTWTLHFDWQGIPWQYHCPLRCVYFANADTGYFAGGHFFERGLIYYTTDGGNLWQTQGLEHELRAVCQTSEGIIAGGYGAMLANFKSDAFQFLNCERSFYTGLAAANPEKVYACTYDGGIYELNAHAEFTKTLHHPNNLISSREHYLCIDAFENIIIACGLSGIVSLSTDSGDSFENGYSLDRQRINAIKILNNSVALAAGDDGQFFRIKIH
ncbi:MAG: hypothetical protein JSS90_09265 [Bacteroidetes bacterium]|jgi:photosystem II stability/assembly factor-like uncharacterized protein|nr:hypothetical protein [Bacteroidota bacterium]